MNRRKRRGSEGCGKEARRWKVREEGGVDLIYFVTVELRKGDVGG